MGRLLKTDIDLDVAMVPHLWNCQMIHTLHRQGLIPTAFLMKFQQFCLDARSGIEAVQNQRNCQLPFPYVQVLAMMVHIAVVQGSIRCGFLLAFSTNATQVCGNLAMVVIVNVLYNGLLSMTSSIEDPFGDGVVDFPVVMQLLQMAKDFRITETLRLDDTEIRHFIARSHGDFLRRNPPKHQEKEDDSSDEEEEEEEDEEDDDDDGGG